MGDAEDISESEEPQKATDLTESDVVNKYKIASDIACKTLTGIISFCKPEIKILTACAFGDTLITRQCQGLYKNKKIEKGIAFPTCISLNNEVCHNCPFEESATNGENVEKFKEGDVVKVDIGVHIDGYIAVMAHSFVIASTTTAEAADSAEIEKKDEVVEEDSAHNLNDVFQGAYSALEAATKVMLPGAKNSDVTDVIKKVADCYNVNLLQGVLMHQMKRFVIDGNNVILQSPTIDQKVETFSFEPHQVYTLDIVMTTGEGKPQTHLSKKPTVFKRLVEQNYALKMKASRAVFHEISKKGTFPFSARSLLLSEEENSVKLSENEIKLGLGECIKHGLIHPYPVLVEKKWAKVCHVKVTVLMMKDGPKVITKIPDMELETIKSKFTSDKSLTEELQEIINRKVLAKKKRNKKKKPAEVETQEE